MLSTISIGPNVGTSISHLGSFTANIATLALSLAGMLTFAYLVYGGVMWTMSGGDATKVEEARNRITHAIIGLAIVASSWAIYSLINNFFGLGAVGDGSSYSQTTSSNGSCSTSSAASCQGERPGDACNDGGKCQALVNQDRGRDGKVKCSCR